MIRQDRAFISSKMFGDEYRYLIGPGSVDGLDPDFLWNSSICQNRQPDKRVKVDHLQQGSISYWVVHRTEEILGYGGLEDIDNNRPLVMQVGYVFSLRPPMEQARQALDQLASIVEPVRNEIYDSWTRKETVDPRPESILGEYYDGRTSNGPRAPVKNDSVTAYVPNWLTSRLTLVTTAALLGVATIEAMIGSKLFFDRCDLQTKSLTNLEFEHKTPLPVPQPAAGPGEVPQTEGRQ